ncbi:GspH/FimT family protein [Pseudomonas sp. CVAP|uniref:GspH/FimT family pseudopilin n=1 Tax=Pseudomonas sp. CVAP\|nr:GspH/FimT family protein [Pseudomonas sp. CVAP\
MHQKGFGLIELLIGLAIAAIVLHQVSPVLSEYTQSVRRETAAQTLASGMRNARTEAILRNQTLVIHALNDDWGQGWRIILDISGEGHQDSSNPLLLERQTSVVVPIVGNRPVRSFVRFSSLGEPLMPGGAFQAGTLHICADREPVSHHQVVLSRSGRVSLRSDKAEQALCAGGEESEQGANA